MERMLNQTHGIERGRGNREPTVDTVIQCTRIHQHRDPDHLKLTT